MPNSTAAFALSLGLVTLAPSGVSAAPDGVGVPFQKAEAPVTGTVAITHTGGKTNLVFSKDFRTNPKAPALQVVLMKSSTPLKTLRAPNFPLSPGSYVQVAPLKSYKGAQTYTLPAGINIKANGSVLIWCKEANATMAWAPLN